MSIKPGSSVTSPRSTTPAESGSGPSGLTAVIRLPVDDHDRRRVDLAGVDVGPAGRPQNGQTVGHGTGSETQSSVGGTGIGHPGAVSSTPPETTP